ncbi:MAG TPA: AraC family transcriptional regulator ligand-binding domain-containing protein [Thermoanaerobaculia bacterium]
MADATIKVRIVQRFLDFAESRGARKREVMQRAGIRSDELERPDERVAFSKYVAAMRAAKELSQMPALALHFGEEVDIMELSIVGMTGSGTGGMNEAFAQLNRHAALDVDFGLAGDRFSVVMTDGDILFIDERPDPNDFPEFTESFFARGVTAMRRWLGSVELVKAIEVTHHEPPYRAEYDRIFQMPVRFNGDRNALRISASIWQLARERFPPTYASQILRGYADAEVEKLNRTRSVSGRLQMMLATMLPSGDVSMQAVAMQLGLSRQTLFRKLKAEGTTYEKLLDGVRHRRALHHLENEKLPVNEVAYLVGFSDPAAFSRAFKRWTGASPRDVGKRK